MLDYKILDYKTKVTRNGKTYYDLMSKSFNYKADKEGGFIIVNKYYVARPDLISLAIYGDDKYADIICKVNGISNPFEMNEDDLIYLPSHEYIMEACKYRNDPSDFVDDEKDTLKKKITSFQKKINQKRSPNEQLEGQHNFVIDKSLGLIFY